ncbi:TolB-like 6-bladed beta-propeller domain-containing protein [Belliella sp. DSM 111904]|uniref:TolB-like 6-bladed beta-propeller domain-containing protein n=1 Tax=Belliella filtrata TaxID=2923435 RepID=A0ABS9UUM9_9BACT|nr:BF3164 family lipoprotein [Belliella filtrata]MCH7407856.1 TolB-like 6-bladed beta-propeller domain-containing protein [Belliella filtrata]
MKGNDLLASILISITILGCSKNLENPYFDKYVIFDDKGIEQIDLVSTKRLLPELINPFNIAGKEGKYLIVIESSKIPEENRFMHLYDPATLEHISEKGVMGFGPNEIPYVSNIDTGFEENFFWAYSSVDKKISKFSYEDKSPYAVSQYKQPESFFKMIRMLHASDSTYLGRSVDEPNRLVEYHANGERIAGYGNWEPVDSSEPLDNYLFGSLNSGWFIGDESKRYYVFACNHRDRLEIFDYHTKKYVVIDGPDLAIPPYELVGSENNLQLMYDINTNPYRYRDVSITKNYVYALYGGFSEKDYRNTGDLAKTIFVFDFNGKPITILNLDCSLYAISVDETVGKIFGITTDADPNVVEFEIPNLLKK